MRAVLSKILWFSKQPGPPDLDQMLARALKRMGQRSKQSASAGGEASPDMPISGKMIALFILVIWALSGIYIVRPAERGVELLFGRYHETVAPGPHWVPRIIGSRYVINVQKIHTFSHRAQMLTKDENIVDVALSVQYRINAPHDYLFNVKDPVRSLMQATASAMRQVVGHTTLDVILTSGRAAAREQMLQQVNQILTTYKTGIEITDLNLQPIKPPEAVTSAFDDAIKAREDEQRYINKALAYQEKVVLTAQGHAKRIEQEANAYALQVLMQAKAGIATYLALLPEHKRAPEVTDFRLYTDALQQVFSQTRKVFLEGDSHAQVMLWPSQQNFAALSVPELATAVNQSNQETESRHATASQTTDSGYHRHSYSNHIGQ